MGNQPAGGGCIPRCHVIYQAILLPCRAADNGQSLLDFSLYEGFGPRTFANIDPNIFIARMIARGLLN